VEWLGVAHRCVGAIGSGLVGRGRRGGAIVGERAALAENAAHVTAIMLREANPAFDFADDRVSAFAIGPGAGAGAQQAVLKVLECRVPTVLDADALTTFEKHSELLFNAVASNDVMTPHLGKFQRIFSDIKVEDRQKAVSRAFAVVILGRLLPEQQHRRVQPHPRRHLHRSHQSSPRQPHVHCRRH